MCKSLARYTVLFLDTHPHFSIQDKISINSETINGEEGDKPSFLIDIILCDNENNVAAAELHDPGCIDNQLLPSLPFSFP